jgi:NhaP-type Na+/H+ or K+/H+ antiporter
MFTLLSSIHLKPEYIAIMGASLIIIISFIFNFISKKTNIPSVLLLLVLGVGIQFLAPSLKSDPLVSQLLIIVGKVGLILIVLEAALDLKLQKDKVGLIVKSLVMALVALVGSALLIAYAIEFFLDTSFFKALVYAVPLSIMSSAIIIPSVGSLEKSKKEFMIYEGTFSDIFGIIFFQFLTSTESYDGAADVALNVGKDLGLTLVIAVVLSYALVWLFQKLTSSVKLFLIIAVLMLVYAVGSVLGISSLIIILFFGLILNNTKVFFRGPLKNVINEDTLKPVFHEFHIITLESAFVLRTFFFVMFGVTISLMSLVDWRVALYSLAIVGILYAVRFIFLTIILFGKSITPQLYIAPRGLITVLLFYTIPHGIKTVDIHAIEEFNKQEIAFNYMDLQTNEITDSIATSFNASEGTYFVKVVAEDMVISSFDPGILLYTILITSLVMTFALILSRGQKVKEVLIDNLNLNYLEDDVVKMQHEEEKEYFEEMDKEFEKEDRDIEVEEQETKESSDKQGENDNDEKEDSTDEETK